ncbi:leucine-rich repeat-containing protein 3B-like [Actinia tenebrosa]|uniref:Leucine-rich repeat-containing protein 3B-like n=1 Tax=Actinia tenebrosa TaxID=6105 RepID=A0A6P8HGP6_ACTTE|nr:leucine-rich repeat-containing protein 3B-like [Actinia tenebrosa]
MVSTMKVTFLILVLWSFAFHIEARCGLVNCICSTNEYLQKTMTCRNISSIPDNIPTDIQKLDVAENSIENITSEKFENLTALSILTLSRNQIRHIYPGTFKSLTAVTNL